MFEASLVEKCPHCRTAQTDQGSPQPEQNPPNHPINKRKKRNTRIAIAAVLGFIIILSAIVAFAVFGGPQHNLTAFNEHLVIYSHTASGTQTVTYLFHLDDEAGKHPAGKQIVIEVPYHYQGTGIENITRMECNTPGFNLAGVSPALPVRLPNTPTIEAGSITLKITFDTPQEPYTGAFDFTVFYDQYP
jgi:hypothetical protein